jgi:hypothetical protein
MIWNYLEDNVQKGPVTDEDLDALVRYDIQAGQRSDPNNSFAFTEYSRRRPSGLRRMRPSLCA